MFCVINVLFLLLFQHYRRNNPTLVCTCNQASFHCFFHFESIQVTKFPHNLLPPPLKASPAYTARIRVAKPLLSLTVIILKLAQTACQRIRGELKIAIGLFLKLVPRVKCLYIVYDDIMNILFNFCL